MKSAETGVSSLTLNNALRRGVTVLTPTQRAARHCLRQYDAARQAEGATAWQAPTVLAWNAWIASLWHEALVQGADTRVLLNSLQERTLWQQAIATGTAPTPAHVRLCQAAVRLLGLYDVDSRYGRYPQEKTGSNHRTFAAWYRRFEALCTTVRCLPPAFAETELCGHIQQRKLTPAAEYILYGFDTLTPAQDRLLAALRTSGAHVQAFRPAVAQQTPPSIVRCTSIHDELRACSTWIRQSLLDHPSANIAIVVPGSDAAWPELERELRSAIAPELSDVTRGEQPPRYEISAGRPLNRLPLVADALRLLRWCTGDLSVEDAGALLRSPHTSLAPSPERGAELDTFHLRQAKPLRAELSLRSAASIVREHDQSAAQKLHAMASAAESFMRRGATYAENAGRAQELLHMAGWPGATDLNSEEHQVLDRWNDALDRLSSLDLLAHRPTLPQAVSDLEGIANEMLFAPENTGAPVQVIDLAEAAGSTSDALWFLHADESTLITHRSPHPFLPVDLQRQLAMPGTSTTQEEDTASIALQHLVQGAGQVMFSYATSKGESAQRLSPLLERLARGWSSTRLDSTPPGQPATTSFLQNEDDSAPLPPLPPGTVHGGVAVIAAQAQCPFRAFAEHRLFASAPQKIEAGYSHADRGEHVHAVLRAFWSQVEDHAGLIQISNAVGPDGQTMRKTWLNQFVGELYRSAAGGIWDEAYLSVQRQRLVNLLSAWLDVEAARAPFKVSAAEKEIADATLGPLTLRLRVDRIDTAVTNGTESALLIDYKTGPAEPRDWSGERPDHPQLPVYAVAAGIQNVQGIAFGGVRPRDESRCLKGHGDAGNAFNLKYLDIPFQVQLSEWRKHLEALARAFAQGDTSVDPKEYPTSCEYCAQRMLCRVEASKPTEVDDDVIDDDVEVLGWQ